MASRVWRKPGGVLLLAGLFPLAVGAAPAPLTVTYIENPPYSYMDGSGKPAGFLLERVRHALAGSPFVLELRSSLWALEEVRRNARPVCSIGWFSDNERRSFAQFSVPIYRDMASVMLFRKDSAQHFSQADTVEKLLAQDVKVGVVGGFSYGDKLNPLLARLGTRKKIAPSKEANLQQLLRREVDAALFSLETVKHFQNTAAIRSADVRVKHYPDIPAGLERHLMCSHKTPKAVIEHFNHQLTR